MEKNSLKKIIRWCSGTLLTSLLLAACGGDGGGEPVAQYALQIQVSGNGSVRSQPTGIDCGSTCSSHFDAGSSVTLTATPGAGQVFSGWSGACNGSAASCTLTLTATANTTATFVAAPAAAWEGEFLLDGDGADQPIVGIDSSGRATAVWTRLETSSGQRHLWSSRSTSTGVWSSAERIESNIGSASSIRLAVDRESGRGMLSWIQQGSTVDLWARPLDPDSGWGPAALVENGSGMVGANSVGVDTNGNALAAWSQIGPATRFSIFANRYTPANGWGTAAPIETNEVIGSVDGDPIVAVAPLGSAVTVWKRSNGTSVHLWSNQYSSASGWRTAVQVVTDAGTNQSIGAHDLALDAHGNGMLVWGQADLGNHWNSTIWFKRLTAGAWQSTASQVAAPVASSLVSTPVLRMNAAGAALVGWGQADNALVAAVASPGAAFDGMATLRSAASRSLAVLPALGIDDAIGALAAWQDPSTYASMTSRLTPGAAWSDAVAQDVMDPNVVSGAPSLAMNERGYAVLARVRSATVGGVTTNSIVLRRWNSGR